MQNSVKITENNSIFALDIGTRKIIGVICQFEGDKMRIVAQSLVAHESRAMVDGQINDIPKVAEVVARVKENLEKQVGFTLKKVAVAAAGRSLVTKSCYVEKEIEENVEIDAELINNLELAGLRMAYDEITAGAQGNAGQKYYCVGHSVVSYYLDNWVTPNLLGHRGNSIGAKVLATFLPQTVVNGLNSVLKRVDLESFSLTLEPIAAIEVAIPDNFRMLNLAMVDIGAGTADIAITQKGSVVAYGMVPVAGDELTEALIEHCLVDFAWAEKIKLSIALEEKIRYENIIGLEEVISHEAALEIIAQPLDRLTNELAITIKELNGGQSPSAVFCVGGGAQTPRLVEQLARKLELTEARVALRGRNNITNILCESDEISGPEGVTVVGIAAVAMNRYGHDFIRLTINDLEYKVFNAGELDVSNALALAGFDSHRLIGKSGQKLEFTLNGVTETIFGGLMKPAEIFLNGQAAHLQTPVHNGDRINVIDAEDGEQAAAQVKDYLHICPGLSLQFNGEGRNIIPSCFLNGRPATYTDEIHFGDQLVIYWAETVADLLKQEGLDPSICQVRVNGELAPGTKILAEGDQIEVFLAEKTDSSEKSRTTQERTTENAFKTNSLQTEREAKSLKRQMTVYVNGKPVILEWSEGMEEPIFLEVFNHLDLAVSKNKGTVSLFLNGQEAGYTHKLQHGDQIKILWKDPNASP